MGIKEKLNKKPLKLLALLLTSMLIATTSALVYYSLSMTSKVAIAATDVWFVLGADNVTAGVELSPDNTSATLTDLRAYPNASYTYVDPLRVRNNGSADYNIRLSHVSLSGNDTEFVYVRFLLREGNIETSATLASLNYTCTGTSWNVEPSANWVSIPAADPDTEWSITVITKAKDNAASASVTIEIAVDVE